MKILQLIATYWITDWERRSRILFTCENTKTNFKILEAMSSILYWMFFYEAEDWGNYDIEFEIEENEVVMNITYKKLEELLYIEDIENEDDMKDLKTTLKNKIKLK